MLLSLGPSDHPDQACTAGPGANRPVPPPGPPLGPRCSNAHLPGHVCNPSCTDSTGMRVILGPPSPGPLPPLHQPYAAPGDDELELALKLSLDEATNYRPVQDEDDELLRRALQASMLESAPPRYQPSNLER